MNTYFDIKDTVYNITQKYKEAITLLVAVGIDQMKDIAQRETIGKTISLEMVLQLKEIDVQTFEERLVEAIEENRKGVDQGLNIREVKDNPMIKVEGVLPCPVKIPLLEGLESWLGSQDEQWVKGLDYNFKAASMGVDWLKGTLEASTSIESISDLFISAGFDLFFDRRLMGKYRAENAFKDYAPIKAYNKDFDHEGLKLRDPAGHYAMLGVVPAIFLVNTSELGTRKIPTSWKELLEPEYENSVSLPIGDFDLFNAILLNIYKNYGETGIQKLGKSLLKSMHPSEMVKSHKKKSNRPAITIMPYFFTKMTKAGGPMEAVWPRDGAIISPIFMLSKSSKQKELKPIIDFFSSKEVGEILSHQGRFPSVHPEVDNRVPKSNPYMWLGWDFINDNDIGQLIKKLEQLFDYNSGRRQI
ncbi:ABC transporter substrate-binding protein [Petrocella sp. FN5]|uniref:ABC transporter substrate-binding protein n=1 Tax=Petrocella sp. FN5 TaxID=3032002 RepID=UPI0023DB6CBD|nr:ABC transporter substrate-binding protein [Petrocella sp. FN5]MDF1616523.1 ABC transporter substrate-binding protein [Petrocella sp. FN5]